MLAFQLKTEMLLLGDNDNIKTLSLLGESSLNDVTNLSNAYLKFKIDIFSIEKMLFLVSVSFGDWYIYELLWCDQCIFFF